MVVLILLFYGTKMHESDTEIVILLVVIQGFTVLQRDSLDTLL